MLRLVRTEAGFLPLRQAVQTSSGPIGNARAVVRYALVGAVGLAAGLWLGGTFVFATPDSSTAMYKRSGAFVRACEAAGAEIAKLRRAATLIDDCSTPVVTPVFGEEGYVIVTRTAEGHAGDDGSRVTYSLKMDGRAIDGWRVLDVKRAPSRLTLDASLLQTTRSTIPASAQR